ncbi:hypothetical protein C8Q74DRAFT_1308285 [Fomes fomentarius]|nr:hypothetical protein C8Q74DRAFT_1308285 [Fomes fomentarius]
MSSAKALDIHFWYYIGDVSCDRQTYGLARDKSIRDFMQGVATVVGCPMVKLRLWKPRDHLTSGLQGQTHLARRLRAYEDNLVSFCDEIPWDKYHDPVSSLFPTLSRKNRQTALVIEGPQPDPPTQGVQPSDDEDDHEEGGDAVAALAKIFAKSTKSMDRMSPSVSAQPPHYFTRQSSDAPILDGRYASSILGVAAPVEVSHPAFATFLGCANDASLSVPDDVVKTTAQFMLCQSQIATAEKLRRDTRKHLKKLVGYSVGQKLNWYGTSSDHIMTLALEVEPYEQASLALIEEKAELGTSGEGSVQGSFSYYEYWNDDDRKNLLQACFCPSFIVSVAGPWLVVCGAIYTSLPIVHRLTDYIWLGYSRAIDDAYTLRVARVFYALRLGIQSLKTYYETLKYNPEDTTSRYFPLATSCILPNGEKLEFKYETPLKVGDLSCVTYLATDCKNPQRRFVVKFVERYGESAHKLLAENNLAPKLLYYGDVWTTPTEAVGCRPRQMVVMEYIHGKTAADLKEVPQCVRDVVQHALDLLHAKGMDSDDLGEGRGDDDLSNRIKIIDFDWAGKEGTVRYPHYIAQIGWVEGVEDYALILASHDNAMVRKLR